MSSTSETITRSEIKKIIASYDRWYQNIRFGCCMETRGSMLGYMKNAFRKRISKEDLVVSQLSLLRGKRVIDIGCNAGLYSVEASCHDASFVLGVDRNPERIAQANDVASIYRRMGRPVGNLEFRVVDDMQLHLKLIDDMDALLACCVLYHLGPLDRLKARLANSRVSTLILQGNMSRIDKIGEFNNPTADGFEPQDKTWGNVVANIAGLSRFAEDAGFQITKAVPHDFPLVIAGRPPRT